MTDMVYLNLAQNNKVDQTEEPVALSDGRTVAILADPGQWNVSLVNFSVPASTVPLGYWDLGTHTITLQHIASGTAYTEIIRYADTRNTSATSGWVWTPNEIVDQTNNALALAFNNLIATHPTTATGPPVISIENGLCVIRAQPVLLTDMNIKANELTNLLFLGMTPYKRDLPLDLAISAADAAIQYSWPMPVTPFTTVESGPSATPVTYIESRQIRPTVATWYRPKQLYFRVGGLSVTGELMPSAAGDTNNASASLLTNFHLTGTSQVSGDGLTYFVAGTHRWYNLRHSGPLQSLDITVYWADSGGDSRQFPVTLARGESAVARLLFRKKSLGLG